ncbi:retinol dehydrogenase 13 [Trichoderma harzianum]|uniref:Retinol dehydrogenase 13 n=1 Tax=Trichoderma harzianum TaxID=5544 RepID=A0A0F9ZW79_TRIHA|nr:retinol dehydrogenase 13 [Trichoderma harzianum]
MFSPKSTATEVAKALATQIRGKTVLITGVSPGSLGSATAMAIASQQPQHLLLGSRTLKNIHSVIDDIHSMYPSTFVEPILMDLSSQKSVRAAAADVNSRISKLDVLINAGIMAVPDRTLSEDGIEIQFATNHLGHFLFTNLILNKLQAAAKDAKKGGDTRIINLSSNGHRISPVRFSDWNFENKTVPPEEQANGEAYKSRGQTLEWSNGYDKLVAYGQSKTASILFSLYLRNNLVESRILSFSVHPGTIMTNLIRHMDLAKLQASTKNAPAGGNAPALKSLDQGAATSIFAAFDPSLHAESSIYLEDCHNGIAEAYASDPDLAAKLWKLSESIVGQNFSLKVDPDA